MNSFDSGFVIGFAEKLYPSESFEWIRGLVDRIIDVADMVGVSPGAIAGIMAEERKDYGRSIERSLIGDFIARYHVEPEILALLTDGTGVEIGKYLLTLINPTVRDHAYWESELAAVNTLYTDINHKPSLDEQLLHPSFIDVGYGNFRIRKAVKLIEDNPALSAQLGLDIYTQDYALLVEAMLNPNSDVTAKLYAMYLKEAEAWYIDNSAYGSNWNALPVEFKDALLVTFVNLGETQMKKLKEDNKSKNDALGYQPVPALGTGGGINHLVNSASIGDVLGLSGYGTKVSAISDIQSLAKNNTPEGLAARYALLNLRPVILPGIDYSTVNQHHELDLYNDTTKLGDLTSSWIDDRALFLNAKGIYDLSGREDNIVNGDGLSSSIINLKDVHLNINLTLQPSVISSDTDIKTFSFGGRLNDVLMGGNGNDRIYGLGGDDKLNGLNGNDVLDGGAGDDELLGGADTDLLLGGKDNDTLDGGAGNDVLKGGAGNDTYKFTDDFGHDTVIDTEGLNTMDINGAVGELKQTAKDSIIYRNSANTVEGVLVDSGGSKTLLLNSLSNPGSSITLDNWSDGQFGVSLKDADAETPPSLPTISGDGGANALSADFASAYETLVYVPPVSLHGGGGHDYIEGSWGGDRIYGDGGNDWIDAGSVYKYSGTITPKAGDPTYDQHGKDLIDGGEGDDVITGRSASSVWHGGKGKDMLLANAALRFDFMFGSYREGGDQFSHFYMSELINAGAGRAVTLDYKWRDLLNYANSGFEILKKTEGQKTLYGYSAWAGITPGTYSGGSSAGNGWSYEFNFVDGEPLKPSAELGGVISSYLYKYPGMSTGDLGGVASHILQSKYTKNGQSRDWEVSLFMHELSLEGGDTLTKWANKPYIQLHGDEGDDLLVGWHGKDELYGGDDNDALFAGAGNDVLDGGSGDDTLFGEAGDDTIIGGSGNDVMVGDSGRTEVLSSNDFLYGGIGNDTLSGNEGNDYLYGGADNDLLSGESGDDYLVGGEGVDTLLGGSGADTLVAGLEDFFVGGGDDNDVYIIDTTIYSGPPTGGSSTPTLSKQKNVLGSQLYGAAKISSMDSGSDAALVIQDTGGENSLFLTGVSSFENLEVTASGSDLIIGHSGKKLIFANGLGGGLSHLALGDKGNENSTGIQINEFLLSNLSSSVSRWAASPGTSIVGGLKDDSLVAHDGGSNLIGGKGNDLLSGGQGDDIYVVRNGDGSDNITEQGGINTINLTEGVIADQLALRRTNGNLLLLIFGGQSVVVNGMFDPVTGDLVANKAIHKIQFSNGDVWDLARILQESVKGSTLKGTVHNDLLISYEGNDTLIGGRGDDTLRGDRGDDDYQFAIGDGADEIDDSHGSDHIYFDEGINETQVSLRKDTNNNLIIRINNNDSITVLNAFNVTGELTAQSIEQIHFNNTSVWDLARIQTEIAKNQFHTFTGTGGSDQLLGDNASQIFNGGKGDDRLNGGNASDVYLYALGDGKDVIKDINGIDRLELLAGIKESEVVVRRDGDDLVLTMKDGGSITIQNTFGVKAANVVDPDITTLIGQLQSHWMSQAEKLIEQYYGLKGRGDIALRFERNEEGNQVARVEATYSRVDGALINLELVIDLGDISNTPIGVAPLYLDRIVAHEMVHAVMACNMNVSELPGWFVEGTGEFIHGADERVKDDAAIIGLESNFNQLFNTTTDSPSTSAGHSVSYIAVKLLDREIRNSGGLGVREVFDHLKTGMTLDQSLAAVSAANGGLAAIWNSLSSFEEHFKVVGFAQYTQLLNLDNLDTGSIVGSDYGNAPQNASSIMPETLTGPSINFNLIVPEQYISTPEIWGALEAIIFNSDGVEWDQSRINEEVLKSIKISGTNSNDILIGSGANEVIEGGGGVDQLRGMGGDDRYIFNRGDGIDVIEDSGGFDTLVFSNIKSTDVYVHRIGGDNYFILKNGEMVRVSGVLSVGAPDKQYQIEKVIFTDTVWDAATIEQKVLEGRALASVKFGSNSWDEIGISTATSTEIYGLEGDDYLQGGAGNDTIDGGAGLNFLEGHEGRDTYLVGENISKNFIENFRGDADRVLFAEGISPDEVRVRLIPGRDESYLERGVLYKYIIPHNRYWNLELVSGDSVTYIDSLFKYDPQTYGAELENTSLQVGTVEFFDGTVWTYSDLIMQALKASSADDAINGTIAADLVQGLEGADTIKSYSGNDSVNGGAGDDRIETGRDNDDISGGLGNDSLSDEMGNDLYRFAAGDGVDTISDLLGLDALIFGTGITKEQTSLTVEGNDQIVTFANSTDKIIIKNGALPAGNNYTDQRIEIFRFENGDEWNFDPKSIPQRKEGNANDEVLVGGYGNDTLIGNQGNDTLQGETGDDEYHYKTGDGFDLIRDTGGTDKVILGAGITSDKVSIRRGFNTYIVSVDGLDAISIGSASGINGFDVNSFIESLVFSSTGEVWDQQTIISKSLASTSGNDTLYGSHLNDVILGGAGNDELDAAQGNDTLIGGVGNDYLVGGKGDDVYRFEQGAGTDVINDISGNDVIEFGSGILPADISVTRNEFDLILKVKNSNPITINGFFESTGSAIRSVNLIQAIEEVVFSTSERWSLDQLLGKISFLGTDSANTIYGLDTNNVIDAKGGNDSVFAGGGNDTVIGGTGMDTLHGEAGDDLLRGGDGNDWLYDAYGSNIFEGGKGNDIISMSYPGIGQQAGSSVIRFSLGDGVDEIDAPTSSPVVIELGAGITADMLAFKSYFVDGSDGSVENKNRIDLLIPGKADQINKLLDNGSYSFKFADNTYWNGEQVVKAINQSKAFLSNDRRVIIGSARPNSKISISYLNKDNTLTKYPIIQSDATGSYQLDFGFGIVDTKRIIISSQDSSGNILPITVFNPAIDMSIPPAPTAELDSSGYVINGFARPGTSIHVLTNGNHLGYASTDKITGAYSFISPLRLVHGETISVLSIVSGLIQSAPATILVPNSSVAADSMPPSIPTGNFDPQGASISGSAEPGTLVFITPLFGSRVLGSAIVGQNGSYSIQLSESIIDGSSVSVVSVDQANNRSYGEIKSSDLTIPMPVSAKFDTTGKYISGSAESSVTGGHQVVVMNSTNTTVLGTIMLPAYESNYKITLTTALKNNEQVNVYVKDAAGNTSYATVINAPDTTKPLVPEAAFDTTGKYITGKAEPGSTVIVKNAAGTQLETTTANAATGEYSITLSTALINKETVKITAKDAAGNVSDIKSLIAPDKTRPAAPSASINSARKVITGSAEAGSIVEVKNTSGSLLGSVTANATTGAYSITLGAALTVNQTVNITAKDAAGNISLPKSLTVSAVAKNLIPSSVLAARFDLGSMIANYEAEFENDAVFENSKVGRVADETIAMYDELENLRSGGVNIDSLVQAIASFDPTAGMSLHIKSLPIDQHNLMLAVES